ncbi:hypothetical protein C6P40_001276 [Pichia californica]|uniref:SKP1 component dimerisation domain-containing protein n=1 Tax=Pichia californica TaxID=460514 RepID=A0A9P6WJB0_9ASCO|nr:hypothetical protein C6P42_001322 [[Candida] californica]KAG0688224.1 hypothetical protein C6P40_001276 [[Candida] californica]
MVYQVRFLIAGKTLTADRHVVEVSVYIRNLLRNLIDNDDSDNNSDSDSDIESGSKNVNGSDKVEKSLNNKNMTIEIPIDNIDYNTMEMILRWCNHFYETHRNEIEQGNMYSISESEISNGNIKDGVNINKSITTTASTSNNELNSWPDNVMDDYQARMSGPVLDMWEREFLDVDADTLKSLILASNFLNIKPLLDTACKIIAELFRGKSPREIINAFNAAHS